MNHSKAIAFATAILFAALWGVPVARAISFFRWAQNYFREDGTINALNDLRYSILLLTCYAASLIVAFAFAWLLARRPRFQLLWPGALLAYAVGEVLWLHQEVPIHLFPRMIPWRPVLLSVVAVAIAARFINSPRRDEHGQIAEEGGS